MNSKPHTVLTNRLAAAALCCCTAVFLGCSKPGPEQHLDKYLLRLSNTLNTEPKASPPAAIPRPPKTSQLRLQLPSANLAALDFLSLTGCAVQVTIGKRNSSLGIMASASQRLLLELEYLELAPECILHLRNTGKGELARTLEAAFTLKRAQLPGLIYNATLANAEYRAFWKKPGELSNYPEQTSSVVLSALAAIVLDTERWLEGDYRANNRAFEIRLSDIARGDGGALLLALTLQEAKLKAANQALRDSLAKGPLCSHRYRHRAADILPTVVHKYFIGGVQPWSAALGRRYHELLPPLLALEQLLTDALPQAYITAKQQRDQAFSRLLLAPAHHVQLLQQVLEPCNSKTLTPAAQIR